jgi:hypothetical protein
MGPISQDMSRPDSGPSILNFGFAFTCDGDALTVKGIYGLSHKETPHIRVAGPEE